MELAKDQIIAALETNEWFREVGEFDMQYPVTVRSWEEALVKCSSEEWREVQEELSNDVSSHLFRADRKRYNKWNDVLKRIKTIVHPLVARKIQRVKTANGLSAAFDMSVQWDICSYYLEVAYSDLVPPAQFKPLAVCYVSGHFPCGWDGAYPDGQLIVY